MGGSTVMALLEAPDLALVASVAVVLAYWRKLAALVWKVCSVFIGEITVAESPLAQAVRAYCVTELRLLPFRRRAYSALNVFVRPHASVEAVAYEQMEGVKVFLKGPWPIVTHGDPSTKKVTVAYLRGTIRPEKFLSAALDHWNYLMRSRRTRRFSVVHVVGHAGSLAMGNDDAKAKAKQIRPAHVFLESRLLRWEAENLGPELARGAALDQFIATPEVEDAIAEARFWIENASWYRDRTIPWRRGWLLHGAPGTGKTSLARALAQDLDLPVFAYDLSSLTNEQMRSAWSDMLKETPCMALLEDLDAAFDCRTNITERRDGLSFDTLLNCIDGVERCDGAFVIITTNRYECVDAALGGGEEKPSPGASARPGRVDRVIQLSPPDVAGLSRVVQRVLPGAQDQWSALVRQAVRGGQTVAQFQETCARLALAEVPAHARASAGADAVRRRRGEGGLTEPARELPRSSVGEAE